MGTAPSDVHQAECAVCEGLFDGDLYPCSKCKRQFHKGPCGQVPTETDYDRPDPDDLHRGQFGGGSRRVEIVISKAVCKIYDGRLSKDRTERFAVFTKRAEQIERHRRELERHRKELETKERQIQSFETSLSNIRETIKGLEAELDKLKEDERRVTGIILSVKTDLHEARLSWKRTKNSTSSLETSNEERRKENELNHIEEYGQSLLFKLDQSEKELADVRATIKTKCSELAQALDEKMSIQRTLSTLQGP